MKKYSLKPQDFSAFKHEGDADATINAMEGNSAGSADSVTFTEHDKSVEFSDADGNSAKALPGDYIKVVNNTDGTFKGYVVVPATVGDNDWVEENA